MCKDCPTVMQMTLSCLMETCKPAILQKTLTFIQISYFITFFLILFLCQGGCHVGVQRYSSVQFHTKQNGSLLSFITNCNCLDLAKLSFELANIKCVICGPIYLNTHTHMLEPTRMGKTMTLFWGIVPEGCIMLCEKPMICWNKISEESVGSKGLTGWWPLPASVGGLGSVCQACIAELQTHRQTHTLPLVLLSFCDAVETSSADTGLFALTLWIKGGLQFLFLAVFLSESCYQCVQNKSHQKIPMESTRWDYWMFISLEYYVHCFSMWGWNWLSF